MIAKKRFLPILMTVLMVFAMMPMAAGAVYAEDNTIELTVNDGTDTSEYVPIYGYYCESYQKSQFVITEDQLTGLAGTELQEMRFYLATPAETSWGIAEFQVFIGAYEGSTVDSFQDISDHTMVYEGSLNGTEPTMDVLFDRATYMYSGGDLLVTFLQTTKGKYRRAYFSGVAASGASVSNTSGSSVDAITTANQRDFAPKVTFTGIHAHSFTYEVSAGGETITAICEDIGGNCTLPVVDGRRAGELTIVKPTMETCGQTGEGISAEATVIDPNNIKGDAIVNYYKANDDGTDKTGEALPGAPTEEGRYWAEITLGTGNDSATAHVVYTISPKSAETISGAAISGITAKTYTGNPITQAPVVKVGDTTLKYGADYTVEYNNNTNVGTATVTITGKGNYSGSKTESFVINPKGTSLSKVKKAKKAATVKWKKQSAKMSSSRITGYQIQLATDSNFTMNTKTVTVKGYKKTSKKVTKLKGGKKYYVRIRTYKTVGGTKYYSPWSNVKTVKTKK